MATSRGGSVGRGAKSSSTSVKKNEEARRCRVYGTAWSRSVTPEGLVLEQSLLLHRTGQTGPAVSGYWDRGAHLEALPLHAEELRHEPQALAAQVHHGP